LPLGFHSSLKIQENNCNCCHKIAYFRAIISPNSISAGAPPQNPQRELKALSHTPKLEFRGKKRRKKKKKGQENERGGKSRKKQASPPLSLIHIFGYSTD